MLWYLLRLSLGLILLAPPLAHAQAALGIPGNGTALSGVGVISGWKCEVTGPLTVRFFTPAGEPHPEWREPLPLLYGSERPDVLKEEACPDSDVGFVAIWNWGNLGDGEHTAVVYDDGVKFGEATFTVVTLGEEFVRGKSGHGTIQLSPGNIQVTVGWDQARQGFNITGVVDAIETFCEDWQELRSLDFRYQNNVWNKGDITNYEQCLLKRSVGGKTQYGWRWQWPLASGGVKAYPEVIYGQKPWSSSSTTSDLPRKISSIGELQVNYEVELTVSGTYNLAFEAWVTSSNPPTPETITHEIMIWVDRTFEPQSLNFLVAEVTIDGVTYDLYITPDFPTTTVGHKYIAFASHPDQLSGTLNVEKFLAYLIDHGHLPSNHYVASVELGNEVIEGKGELWLRNLQINVD